MNKLPSITTLVIVVFMQLIILNGILGILDAGISMKYEIDHAKVITKDYDVIAAKEIWFSIRIAIYHGWNISNIFFAGVLLILFKFSSKIEKGAKNLLFHILFVPLVVLIIIEFYLLFYK